MSKEHRRKEHRRPSSRMSPKDRNKTNIQADWSWEMASESQTSAPLDVQAQHLADTRLTPLQRQAMASRLGRIGGNRYLQRVKDSMTTMPEGLVVQREDDHDHEHGETPHVHAPQAEGGAKKDKFLDAAAALKVLQDAFGSYKKMVKGKVKVLAQADFQKAYDKIYGKTKYSWAKWVVPKHGNLGGFAYKGVNYVNQDVASSTTTPHEMLHNNADASWSGAVGSNIDEGVTEYLTFVALKKAGHTKMTEKYPNQHGVIKALVATIGDELIKKAYFNGKIAALKTAFNTKCKGTWVDFKAKMDASKWTQAKALAAAK